VKLLFNMFEKLSKSYQNQDIMRKEILEDLLCLLESDYVASYIWDKDRKIFDQCVFLNMSPDTIASYNTYYRFHDPITPLLKKRRRATFVCEVMAQEELEKTEFFNDFLIKDGLHHGINVYAYDGLLNIGDLRVWRVKKRPEFDVREKVILNAVLPHFRNALRNIRTLIAAQGISNFWHNLLDESNIALFLFDEAGNLAFQNNEARIIERNLTDNKYDNFYDIVCSLKKKDLSKTELGPYVLSVFSTLCPVNSKPVTAVIVHKSPSEVINKEALSRRYQLSQREIDVCLLVCKGLTDREISNVLEIAFSTVRTHLKRIYTKLDVTNRTELISSLLEGIVDFSF